MRTTVAKLICAFVLSLPLLRAEALAQDLACLHSDLLDRVAEDILNEKKEPSPEELAEFLQNQGGDATRVYASIRSTAAKAEHATWLAKQKSRADGRLCCGQAANKTRSVVVATIEGGSLLPLNSAEFKIAVYPGFHDALVVMRDARGQTLQRKVRSGDVVVVPRNLLQPIAVQLVATGRDGPRPVALRWLGQPKKGSGKIPTTSIEAWVKALRAETQGEPLRYNRVLSDASGQYAREVCASGKVAHVKGGQSPVDRLKVLGITAEIVGEIVGRAQTQKKALESLAQSPTHRLTVQDNRFTDFGYGEAIASDGKVCLVVSFAAWPTMLSK